MKPIYVIINSNNNFIDEKCFSTKKAALNFANFCKYDKKSNLQIPQSGWGTGTYLQKIVDNECVYERYFNSNN